MIEDRVLPERDVRLVMMHFLKRRMPIHYALRPHPRTCSRTIQVIGETFTQVGCTFEILPPNLNIAERRFVEVPYREVTTIFSSSVYLIHSWYDIPFDSATAELLYFGRRHLKQATLDHQPLWMEMFQMPKRYE